MTGGYAVLKYGGGQAGILRTWGKYIASSAATFGYTPRATFVIVGFLWYYFELGELTDRVLVQLFEPRG